jgi:transcriptional regulator with XRE-family HTH domain
MSAASAESGLSTSTAFRIECRRSIPRIDTLERFARALGVSPSWLAYGEGEEDAASELSFVASTGERLAAARQQSGLTRKDLGLAAQLTGQTVANIETGRMIPRVDTVEMLAGALGVSPSWLAFGDRAAATMTMEMCDKR